MRLRSSLPLLLTGALVVTTVLGAPATSAEGAGRGAQRVLGQPTLRVEPASIYLDGDMPTLRFDVYEDRDGLPTYSVTLTDASTGQGVPMGFGYASSPPSYSTSEAEGPYQVKTAAPLSIGDTYEATMTLNTVGHLGCSIYYKDGCHWISGGTDVWHWRFTWNGAALDAFAFDPPPPPPAPKAPARIKLIKHGPYGDDALTFTWQLRRNGEPDQYARVIGQWGFRNGGWHKDRSFRTDSRGRLALWLRVGPKRSEPNRYRLVFAGNSTTKSTRSKPVRLHFRR